MKLLDFDFAGFLVDTVDEDEENEYSIKYVEDILYEKNYFIWTLKKEKAKKLNELGLQYYRDYYVNESIADVTINRTIILDTNLTYNFLADSKYPGIMIYGDDKKDDFKIAVLGGSTTDGSLYPFKSWPQLLFEEIGMQNITIYNGGVTGYTSGEELLKLIRDIIPLNPNMIIVYDGFNDLNKSSNVQYPFTNGYLKQLFDYASDHIDDERCNNNICMGIAAQQNRFSNWFSNIRTMYAVANERNIAFFCFCQPVLSSKMKHTISEKNQLLSNEATIVELYVKEAFRTQISQLSSRPKYMYDLSSIFDEEEDVYMDICHVWEKGNRIIASEIKKIILPAIKGAVFME